MFNKNLLIEEVQEIQILILRSSQLLSGVCVPSKQFLIGKKYKPKSTTNRSQTVHNVSLLCSDVRLQTSFFFLSVYGFLFSRTGRRYWWHRPTAVRVIISFGSHLVTFTAFPYDDYCRYYWIRRYRIQRTPVLAAIRVTGLENINWNTENRVNYLAS
jgi:hypothetical protein